jgi:hypothetical protein
MRESNHSSRQAHVVLAVDTTRHSNTLTLAGGSRRHDAPQRGMSVP